MDLSREDQLDSRLPTSQYIQEPKVKPEKIGGETMMGMVENPLEPATWPGVSQHPPSFLRLKDSLTSRGRVRKPSWHSSVF